MSAFHANKSALRVIELCLWLSIWFGAKCGMRVTFVFWTMIIRWNQLHSASQFPTRQNETLEGCRNGRASQIERAWAQVCENAQLCCRNKLEGCRNGRASQIERARAEVNAKPISHKLSAQIPTKKGLKIKVTMTGRKARAHKVQNNSLHDQAKPD